MDSFKDVLEAAQAYCKTQMAEPTYNLYIDGLEPISFEDSSHIICFSITYLFEGKHS